MDPEEDVKVRPLAWRWGATTKVIVSVVLIVLFGLFFYLFRVILVPLLVATIMALVFYPIVNRLSTATRLSHSTATMLLYLILVALIVPIVLLLGPEVVDQIVQVQSELISLIQYLNQVTINDIEFMDYTIMISDVVGQMTSELTTWITRTATRAIAVVMGAARTGFLAAFSLVISFYLTRDAKKFVGWFLDLAPPAYKTDFRRIVTEIGKVWTSFFRGQLTLCLIVGLILGIVSAILGLPQPILLGVWGGLLELLPSIGNTIWGATAVLLAIFFGSTHLALPPLAFALLVFGVFFAFIQLDTNILIPNIIGVYIRLHPVIIILGIIIGLEIGGVLGMAIAAPTIASLRVVGRYVYAMLFDLDPFPEEPAPINKSRRNRREAKKAAQTATPHQQEN